MGIQLVVTRNKWYTIYPIHGINFRSYSKLLLKSKVSFSINRLSSLLRFIVFAASAIFQKKRLLKKI